MSVRAKGKIIAGLQERIAAFEPLPVPGIGESPVVCGNDASTICRGLISRSRPVRTTSQMVAVRVKPDAWRMAR